VKLYRRFVADRTVWTHLVMVSAPGLAFCARFVEAHEPVGVQALCSELAVEGFDEGVIRRFAGAVARCVGRLVNVIQCGADAFLPTLPEFGFLPSMRLDMIANGVAWAITSSPTGGGCVVWKAEVIGLAFVGVVGLAGLFRVGPAAARASSRGYVCVNDDSDLVPLGAEGCA
jgi:hypothetical protein